MPIKTLEELGKATEEWNALRDAPEGTPQAARRDDLDAEIKAFHTEMPQKFGGGTPGRY